MTALSTFFRRRKEAESQLILAARQQKRGEAKKVVKEIALNPPAAEVEEPAPIALQNEIEIPSATQHYQPSANNQCKRCHKAFSRSGYRARHEAVVKCKRENFWCKFCARHFYSRAKMLQHEEIHLRRIAAIQSGGAFPQLEGAHGCKIFEKSFIANEVNTIEGAFLQSRQDIIDTVTVELITGRLVKFGTVVSARCAVLAEDGNIERFHDFPLRSTHRQIFLADERRLGDAVNNCMKETLERLDGLMATGSGWILLYVNSVRLEVGFCTLIGGASPDVGDVLPERGGEYLIDVILNGERCFLSAYAQHFIADHTTDVTEAWIAENCNLKKVKLPMDIHHVAAFEKKNLHLKMGVNVFLLEGGQCFPVHRSKVVSATNANLLLVSYLDAESTTKYHFCYVVDIDSFLSLYKGHDNQRRRIKSLHCGNCLSNFTGEQTLAIHQEICLKNKTQLTLLPNLSNKLMFTNHRKRFGHEFIGVADFEAALIPENRSDHPTCQNCQDGGSIRKCSHTVHIKNNQFPVCYCLIFVDRNKNVVFQRCETAPDVMPLFFKAIHDAERLLFPQLQACKANIWWSKADEKAFRSAKVCHVCHGAFELVGAKKRVRDHCHRTGVAVGAAHWDCNVKRRVKNRLIIYIHNLSGYDSHFIIKNFKRTDYSVRGLATNMQRFKTLDIGKSSFVDSLSLLDAGLAELVSDVVKSGHTFPILKSSGIYNTEAQRKLLLFGKGIYPYEYVDSFERLSERKLPPRGAFYSSLSERSVSVGDYNQACDTFAVFDCFDLKDYTALYCRLDTILLAEVLFEFIGETFTDFGLDVTNYISLPQISFDAMLKMTNVQLDYIPDTDMILAFENGIRGGVSYVNKRHVDVEKEGGVLVYLDFNNLYGFAQMQKVPARKYRWLSADEIEQLDVETLDDDARLGYALEVDLHYPLEVRELHQQFPLAPEHLEIFHDDLSEYSKECLKVTTGKANLRYHTSKLCGTFYDKKKYLIHYRNLKYYMQKGLVVTRIHRVIEFEQEAFVKPYIEFTAKKRAEATSPFKRRTAKLYANANFGKFLQNVRKHMEVKIASKESTVKKYLGSPRFKSFRVLNSSLVAIFLEKKVVTLDKKYSVGFTILELSKLAMYECFYDIIIPRFSSENVEVVMSDTDSFILHIRKHSRDVVRQKMRDIMDFSNLHPEHPLYSVSRSKVPGYLKDETPNSMILECVAPKSKCYALRIKDDSTGTVITDKKCKGVSRVRVKRLDINSYRKCITTMTVVKASMARMHVRDHRIQTILQQKVCMSSFDDKRFLKDCGRHSYPYQKEKQSNICLLCRGS